MDTLNTDNPPFQCSNPKLQVLKFHKLISMKTTVSILTSGLLVRSAIAETIHGVTVFTRHGDRTSKHYSGYRLTNLGVTENFEVGSDYRDLYIASGAPKQILGISESTYVPSQIFASAPDQQVLLNTATAFMQGLYPPLSDIDGAGDLTVQSLNNGSSYESPLNGYQYVVLHGEESTAPDTIWIKGDEGCPASTKAQSSFEETPEYLATVESTRSFYEGFWDVLQNVYDYSEGNLTYDNAYDIYDLVNVASIHNASLASNITASELFQLRTLADSYEWGHNYNASQSARSTGGQTLAGGILSQLNQTITSKGKLKFSLLAGSYDNFMAFFGIMNLTSASPDFYGLPSYASTMAFELFTESNLTAFPETTEELSIRFLFRNGSDAGAPLQAFPLFGGEATSLPWETFSSEVKKRAITSVGQWCNACNATQSFCPASSEDLASAEGSSTSKSGNGGMSNAVAGVIGAMVTLAVALLVALAYFLLARRKRSAISAQPSLAKVESEHS